MGRTAKQPTICSYALRPGKGIEYEQAQGPEKREGVVAGFGGAYIARSVLRTRDAPPDRRMASSK